MFKKFATIMAVFTLCLFATTAFAEMKSFSKFKIDVPANWSSTVEGDTVTLLANDKSASVTITAASTQGMTLKDLAAAFASQLKGSAAKEEEPDLYVFTFKAGAAESKAIITGDDKEFCMVVMTGDNAQVQTIVESLTDL